MGLLAHGSPPPRWTVGRRSRRAPVRASPPSARTVQSMFPAGDASRRGPRRRLGVARCHGETLVREHRAPTTAGNARTMGAEIGPIRANCAPGRPGVLRTSSPGRRRRRGRSADHRTGAGRPGRRRRRGRSADHRTGARTRRATLVASLDPGDQWPRTAPAVSGGGNPVRSGRLDSNQRPPDPQSGALPGCATPRGRAGLVPHSSTSRKSSSASFRIRASAARVRAGTSAAAAPAPRRSWRRAPLMVKPSS